MAVSSVITMAKVTGLGGDVIRFLGTPIIALAVGAVFAVIQLLDAGKMEEFYDITNDTLKTVGPILFVTAAGGVLGKVISSTDMVNYITGYAAVLSTMGIFFPFVLAAILKSAQGSSTVAMTVSHANDSYFWVVTNFGEMTPQKGYKTQTVATLILGLAGIVEIFVLSLILH